MLETRVAEVEQRPQLKCPARVVKRQTPVQVDLRDLGRISLTTRALCVRAQPASQHRGDRPVGHIPPSLAVAYRPTPACRSKRPPEAISQNDLTPNGDCLSARGRHLRHDVSGATCDHPLHSRCDCAASPRVRSLRRRRRRVHTTRTNDHATEAASALHADRVAPRPPLNRTPCSRMDPRPDR